MKRIFLFLAVLLAFALPILAQSRAPGVPWYDPVNNQWHLIANGVDTIVGSGSGTTLQTNGSNNASQALLNIITSVTNSCGTTVTPSNPSGGQEKLETTGTQNAGCGGTGLANPTVHTIPVAEGSSSFNLVSCNITGQSLIGSNGADPACQSPGIADGNAGAHVTTTPYNPTCDSATAVKDRAATLVFDSGSSVINIPDHTTSGNGANCVLTLINESGGSLTVNRSGLDTLNITGISGGPLTGQTTFTLLNNVSATLNNGEAAIWNVRIIGSSTPTFDKTATGLLNPTADATFTYPPASVSGLTLAGTAPASSAGAGAAASTLFNINAVVGGATTGSATTAGAGSSPSIVAGAGGSGAGGTNASGGSGGSITLTAGAGGTSGGTAANSNGGNITLTVGSAGTGGSGAAGKAGVVSVSGPTAGLTYYTQGSQPTTANTNIPANSLFDFAPAAVTAYSNQRPGSAAQGEITGTLSGSVITQGFSGDANHSTTVTIGSGTSIGSTSLCSTANCPAGTYRINAYIDITTACTTTGTYIVNLIYTDDQGSKTVPINIQGTGTTPATGSLALSAVTNFGQAAQILRSTGAASINYSTTATACGTGGPMVGKLYLSVVPEQ